MQIVRHVNMLDGVTVAESTAQKDEIILEGNDIENVSQSGEQVGFSTETNINPFANSCLHSRFLPGTKQRYPKGWYLFALLSEWFDFNILS